jgi:catechol 2,3-dioxygenase-like lactoylglutathione lyase family enzyme
MRLNQVMLFVTDMARMKAFYRGIIGLPVLEDGAEWARLGDAGCALALHVLPGSIPDPPIPRLDSYIKVCFHADDVDAMRASLVERGVEMKELHRFESATFCNGVDPEGNIFQITSR